MKIEERKVIADGQLVSYRVVNNSDRKKTPIVFLHGWRSNSSVWEFAMKAFAMEGYPVMAFDLPGFGGSENPKKDFYLRDYTRLIHSVLKKLNVAKPILIGHSFGGSVSIQYSMLYPQDLTKMVLVGSAGIRKKSSRPVLSRLAGLAKPLLKVPGLRTVGERIKQKIGSEDYIARPDLESTFKNIMSEDLSSKLGRVEVETLLVWGEEDQETPLQDGLLMERTITRSRLVTYEKAGHYPFIDDSERFIRDVHFFVEPENKRHK